MTTTLINRCLRSAASHPAHLLSGTTAGLIAALVWNPLPVALFAVGSGIWLTHAATSLGYAKRLLQAESDARDDAARRARKAHFDALALQQLQPPFSGWVKHGALPDYANRYRELELTGARIAEAVAGRPELALEWTLDLKQEVNRLLETYLALARARLSQLDLLCGGDVQTTPRAPGVEGRLAEADKEIARLRALADQEPAAAEIRRSHLEVLERRKVQLQTCAARDARLAAQMEALVDVFRFLLERVSGADVDSAGITEYLGGVLTQVQEAQRWAEVAPLATEATPPRQAERAPMH